MTGEFRNVPARDIGEGCRLVTPEGTLTAMVQSVEWGGDTDGTDFEVAVFLDTDDEFAGELNFRSDTQVWTVWFDDSPPSTEQLAAHRPITWTESFAPAGEQASRVLREVAQAHQADARIGPRATALVEARGPGHETTRNVIAEIARELHVAGDDGRSLAVAALLDEPFDGDYGHWGGTDACIALAGYIVSRRSGFDDEQFRHWHERFTEPDRWTRTMVQVHPVDRLYELYHEADASYRDTARDAQRPAAITALDWALELWMRGAPGGDPSWNDLATRIDELVADLQTLG